MCLFPFGGLQNILVPPTPKAKKLAVAFRVVLVFHLLFVIFSFLSEQWLDASLDLLAFAIGVCAIKSPDGYSFQQCLCYTILVGVRFVWEAIRMAIFFSGVSSDAGGVALPGPEWQQKIYAGTLIAGPIIYTVATILGWMLYKELKNIINEMASTMQNSDWGNGPPAGFMYDQGSGGYSQVPTSGAGGGATYRSSVSSSTADTSSGSFKAFAGQGHKLGAV